MKRYIKFIISGVMFTLLPLCCAAAEVAPIEDIDLNTETKILTISGYNISEKYDKISYEVLKSGIEWGEEIPDEDGEQTASEDNGIKELSDFDFTTEKITDYLDAFGQISAAPQSRYTITVKHFEGEKIPMFRLRFGREEIVYFDPETLDKINEAATADALKEAVCENTYIWNKVSESYNALFDTQEKQDIYWAEFLKIKNAVTDAGKQYNVPTEVVNAAKNAVDITVIRCADTAQNAEKLIEYCIQYGIQDSNSYKLYSNDESFKDVMSTAQKSALLGYIIENRNTYQTLDAFITDFWDKVVLYSCKDSASKYYINTVLTSSDRLSGGYMTDYRELSNSKQIDICEILAEENILYTTVDKLIEAVENAASDVGKSSGGNGGGSGGGGGSAGSVISQSSVPATDIQETEITYSDIDTVEWAKEAIEYLSEKGIVSGRGNGIFDPHAQIKREEFVTILVLALGEYDSSAAADFDDVDRNAWYHSYVASAVNAGLVYGVGDNSFGTGKIITRQEMAAILYRAALARKVCSESLNGTEYTDNSAIADWAKKAALVLRECGIMSGMDNNTFAPLESANRAQAAQAVYKLLKRMEAGI